MPRPAAVNGWSIVMDPMSGLAAADEYHPPATWTADHVMVRMVDAFDTLARLRVKAGPQGFKTIWPRYQYDTADLNAQMTIGERELNNRKDTARPFVLPPTAAAVDLMEEAFGWPAAHLGRDGKVRLTRWALDRQRGRQPEEGLVIAAHEEAERIAASLRRKRVPVR